MRIAIVCGLMAACVPEVADLTTDTDADTGLSYDEPVDECHAGAADGVAFIASEELLPTQGFAHLGRIDIEAEGFGAVCDFSCGSTWATPFIVDDPADDLTACAAPALDLPTVLEAVPELRTLTVCATVYPPPPGEVLDACVLTLAGARYAVQLTY